MPTSTATAAPYIGRFAPSPTGPLHLGSLVSALASYLDARAHGGLWLVRIEDIDGPRSQQGVAEQMLADLAALGMHADAPPLWQSARTELYEVALAQLTARGVVYPCGCTRREIADSLLRVDAANSGHVRHTTLAYPGTCRAGLHGKPARAWRLRVPAGAAAELHFEDRWHGTVSQNLETEVGDFVLKRADGMWAYQLAVVVDDADCGITHIVRGADLLDSTARQIYLQQQLEMPTPAYLHVPVVITADGEKLSKQTGAPPLDLERPLAMLTAAARHLGLELGATEYVAQDNDRSAAALERFYRLAVPAWAARMAARPLA
jgi:glutamyl-Q tRNA(Asp) synthetase